MRFEDGIWIMTIVSVLFFITGFLAFHQRNQAKDHKDETLELLLEDMNRYIEHLSSKHPNDPRIKRLKRVVDGTKFKALSEDDDDVGYSIDKGNIIAVCTEDGPTNEAIFVLLHELAHVATEEWGHGDVFWSNFSFLIDAAEKFGWYNPTDYRKTPGSICGTKIETAPDIDYDLVTPPPS